VFYAHMHICKVTRKARRFQVLAGPYVVKKRGKVSS
jgi:hypothetical protein